MTTVMRAPVGIDTATVNGNQYTVPATGFIVAQDSDVRGLQKHGFVDASIGFAPVGVVLYGIFSSTTRYPAGALVFDDGDAYVSAYPSEGLTPADATDIWLRISQSGGGDVTATSWDFMAAAPQPTNGCNDGDTFVIGSHTYTMRDTVAEANDLKISAGNGMLDTLGYLYTIFTDDAQLAAYIASDLIGPGTQSQVGNGITVDGTSYGVFYGEVVSTSGAGPWSAVLFLSDDPITCAINSEEGHTFEPSA